MKTVFRCLKKAVFYLPVVVYDVLNRLRPIKSDSQRWLDNYSTSLNRPLTFIQVGANDGLRQDPFRRFIIRDDWTGILVEPVAPVFELLKKNYKKKKRLYFENCIILDTKDNQADFFVYSDSFLRGANLEKKLLYWRKSSLSRNHLLQRLKHDHLDVKEEYICRLTIPTLKISDLMKKYSHLGDVDLLIVDAEGYDDFVIKTVDFSCGKPKAIFFESSIIPSQRLSDLKELLYAEGYDLNTFGMDTVAVLSRLE